jgi:hypothetical protein
MAFPTKESPLAISQWAPMNASLMQDDASLLWCEVMLGNGHADSGVVVLNPLPFLTSFRAVGFCTHFAHFHILIGASTHRAAHVFHIFTSTARKRQPIYAAVSCSTRFQLSLFCLL